MRESSRAWIPWGDTAESVPKPMVTPASSASLNDCACAFTAASILARMAGGKRAACAGTDSQSSARGVGTSTVPRRFMSARVPGLMNVPCSMDVDARLDRCPGGRVAVAVRGPFRLSRCASLTIAPISAAVSCGTSTASDSDSTPPEAAILMTSAPYSICVRTACAQSSAPLHTPSKR